MQIGTILFIFAILNGVFWGVRTTNTCESIFNSLLGVVVSWIVFVIVLLMSGVVK